MSLFVTYFPGKWEGENSEFRIANLEFRIHLIRTAHETSGYFSLVRAVFLGFCGFWGGFLGWVYFFVKSVDLLLWIGYISTIEKIALSHGVELSFECLVLSFELELKTQNKKLKTRLGSAVSRRG